jgi:TRAP-type C4-dicarboxylate transport system permease small subunit
MVKNGIGVKSSSMGISMAIPYIAMVIGSVGMIIENTLNLLNPSRIMIDTIVEEMK